ncbi:MAG: hypothetical protein ISS57_11085 [Anaerolineales bacterium]|nr:hypothetical protein [Anaerolineales bacterium]
MFSTFIAVVLAMGLLLGGGAAATVYAAQDSLPASPLYPVKLFSEDVRLELSDDPREQLDLLTQFNERRVAEITQLVENGEALPEDLGNRLQVQTYLMLQLAAGMDESALLQVQSRLRELVQVMEKLQTNQPENADPQLVQIHAMLEGQHQIAQTALDDPGFFQTQFGNQQAQGDSQGNGQQADTSGQEEILIPESSGGLGDGGNAGSGNNENGNGESGNSGAEDGQRSDTSTSSGQSGSEDCAQSGLCTPVGGQNQTDQSPGQNQDGTKGSDSDDNGKQNGKP